MIDLVVIGVESLIAMTLFYYLGRWWLRRVKEELDRLDKEMGRRASKDDNYWS